MLVSDLFSQPWVIGIASGIATALLVSFGNFIIRRLRAYKGPFSGQYLALNFDPNHGFVLVEEIICRHVGHLLSGTIRGITTLKITSTSVIPDTLLHYKAEYRLEGFVDERVLVVSYRTTSQAALNIGALVLKADNTGTTLSGIWSGLLRAEIGSGRCTWLRIQPAVRGSRKPELLLAKAVDYLEQARIAAKTVQIKPEIIAKIETPAPSTSCLLPDAAIIVARGDIISNVSKPEAPEQASSLPDDEEREDSKPID